MLTSYRPRDTDFHLTYKLNSDTVRKLPGIPRELPRHIDRATYPEGMLRILFRKHYADSPLLPNELDA
jgi:hypothetical protein